MLLRVPPLLILASVLSASACTPTCRQACRKLLACDLETSRLSIDACEDDCNRQQALYQTWEDTEKQDLFREHKACIGASTCGEIDAGVCYVDDLFVF